MSVKTANMGERTEEIGLLSWKKVFFVNLYFEKRRSKMGYSFVVGKIECCHWTLVKMERHPKQIFLIENLPFFGLQVK